MSAVLDYLPKGNTLSDEEWHRRHRLLQWLLAGHLPALFLFGVLRGYSPNDVSEVLALPLACLIIGHLMRSRRLAASFITLGLVYCSAALVGFSNGAIEAHFHFFIIIGFIALYQDWVPFLLNIVFTVLSHGIGSSLVPTLMFNHASAQQHPWQWSLIHGGAVLAACVGVVLFWKKTEDEQQRSLGLTKQLADAEISRRRFTSDLLVNLARRNQNLLYRQLELLNDLEDKERDPDALAHLFRLDHLATRIRRNAENLLVLSGEESPRTWREPVALADVMRAAIAEIEDLDRVDESVDETLSVSGRSVADLTHLFAELLENAVHFSPPGVTVVVRSRPQPSSAGTHLVTIEDWGVGMSPAELAEANEILRHPRDVDLSVSQRLGLHVVARLAQRYGIAVELTGTPGGGVTAVATLPPSVFARSTELVGATAGRAGGADGGRRLDPRDAPTAGYGHTPGPSAAQHLNGTGTDLGRPAAFDGRPPRPAEPGPDGRLGGTPDGRLGGTPDGRPDGRLGGTPGGLAGGPALETPQQGRRPTPPLPPDPNGHAGSLPRRDPGEAMARSRPADPDAVRPELGAPREVFPRRAAGGDGAAQPGREPEYPSNGQSGNGYASDGRPLNGRTGFGTATDGQSPTGSPTTGNGSTGAGSTGNGSTGAGNGSPSGDGGWSTGGDGSPTGDDGWSSWWTPTTPPGAIDADPQPEPRPEPGPHPPNGAGRVPLPEPRTPADHGDGPQLRRRVPQANLAAGLRRDAGGEPEPEDAPVVRDPMAARNALSRFQAAQRAARDAVEGDREGGPR